MKHLIRAVIVSLLVVSPVAAQRELTPDARAAIKRGLEFLKRTQSDNGAWRCKVGYKLNYSYRATSDGTSHIGVTSLAGIAFLANGNLPGRGKYGDVVSKALEYVLSKVKNTGYITDNGSRMYSHAFATLFLAEVYGMTKMVRIREKLKRAVKSIVDSQNDTGGWRYLPGAPDADMSIAVCQVQALRAARNAGITVPRATITKAIGYVKRSARWDGAFKYQDLGRSRVSFALTAAGVTALHGAGVYSDTAIEKGLNYLERNRHDVTAGTYFFYYGQYYAVQAMYMAGGRHWQRWFPWIRDELVKSQTDNGSWPSMVGTPFGTSMSCIILQIPYRYLPIFQR